MTLRGIDVSSFQGNIDWRAVAASGIDFAIARCVRETGAVDDRFVANIAGMRANGILPGAYCFLDEGNAAAQAEATVEAIGYPDMLVVLDVETGSGTLPTVSDIREWTGIVRNAFPSQPILLYGSPGVLSARGNLAGFGPWWRADYGPKPYHEGSWDAVYAARGGDPAPVWEDDASGWTRAAIWQFSSRGIVPGISGRVDLDASKLTRLELEAMAGLVVPASTHQAELALYQASIAHLTDALEAAPGIERDRIAAAEAERIKAL